MRIIVVASNYFSKVGIEQLIDTIPAMTVVATVESILQARQYCERGKADLVISDAVVVGDLQLIPPDPMEILGEKIRIPLPRAGNLPGGVSSSGTGYASPSWVAGVRRVGALSLREREVFDQLGMGSSNREISRALSVSERTVKSHVAHILDKLGVNSRLQAGLAALTASMFAASVAEVDSASTR